MEARSDGLRRSCSQAPPVAEAVLDDVGPRVDALAERARRSGSARSWSATTPPAPATCARSTRRASRSASRQPPRRRPRRRRRRPTLLDGRRPLQRRPGGRRLPHPAPGARAASTSTPRSSAIDPAKDADGLHPVNLGKLVLQEPGPVPCTPAGIQAMLVHYGIDVAGRDVVIVGRGPDARPAAGAAAHAQAAGRQRRGHRGPHRRARPGRLHPRGRHRGRRGRRAVDRHARHGAARCRGGHRRRQLGGHASCCPTSTRPSARWRRGSRPASAASAPPPSPCCCATRSRPPSGRPGTSGVTLVRTSGRHGWCWMHVGLMTTRAASRLPTSPSSRS